MTVGSFYVSAAIPFHAGNRRRILAGASRPTFLGRRFGLRFGMPVMAHIAGRLASQYLLVGVEALGHHDHFARHAFRGLGVEFESGMVGVDDMAEVTAD